MHAHRKATLKALSYDEAEAMVRDLDKQVREHCAGSNVLSFTITDVCDMAGKAIPAQEYAARLIALKLAERAGDPLLGGKVLASLVAPVGNAEECAATLGEENLKALQVSLRYLNVAARDVEGDHIMNAASRLRMVLNMYQDEMSPAERAEASALSKAVTTMLLKLPNDEYTKELTVLWRREDWPALRARLGPKSVDRLE